MLLQKLTHPWLVFFEMQSPVPLGHSPQRPVMSSVSRFHSQKSLSAFLPPAFQLLCEFPRMDAPGFAEAISLVLVEI